MKYMDTRKEEEEFLRRAIAALNAMTLEERVQIAVRAGILSADGKLTKAYGGEG